MTLNQQPAPLGKAIARNLIRLAVLVVAIILINMLLNWLLAVSEANGSKHLMLGVLSVMVIAYILLMATPFVPGIEIGLSLMFMRGDEVVIVVYLATVTGLMLAFLAGRFIPYSFLRRVFLDLRLYKASELLENIQPLSTQERLQKLDDRAPSFLRPLLTRYRYVLIAALINIPGNALIGGGGGIMLVAGLSRLFTVPAMITTLLIAVSPVPLLVLLFDIEFAGF